MTRDPVVRLEHEGVDAVEMERPATSCDSLESEVNSEPVSRPPEEATGARRRSLLVGRRRRVQPALCEPDAGGEHSAADQSAAGPAVEREAKYTTCRQPTGNRSPSTTLAAVGSHPVVRLAGVDWQPRTTHVASIRWPPVGPGRPRGRTRRSRASIRGVSRRPCGTPRARRSRTRVVPRERERTPACVATLTPSARRQRPRGTCAALGPARRGRCTSARVDRGWFRGQLHLPIWGQKILSGVSRSDEHETPTGT